MREELEAAGEMVSVARIPREAMITPQSLWDWYRQNVTAENRE